MSLEWSLLAKAISSGLGQHVYYLSMEELSASAKWSYACSFPYVWVMAFIKISLASLLLRLRRELRWKWFLWTMIIIQILSAIASNIFLLVQCRPIHAFWDRKPEYWCAPLEAAHVSLYVNSSIAIATDVMFAVLPIIFVLRMQLALREKVVVVILFGLGLFATSASIVKASLINKYGDTGDLSWDTAEFASWSLHEEEAALIAANIPYLKVLFERMLIKVRGHLTRVREKDSQASMVARTISNRNDSHV